MLVLAVFISSCEKEEVSLNPAADSITSMAPTHLTFKTVKDLQEAIKMSQLPDFEEINKLNHPNFISYNDAYYQALEDITIEMDVKGRDLTTTQIAAEFPVFVGSDGTGEEEILPLIHSYTMRKLLDQNGVITVGKKVYQYGYNEYYVAPVQNVTNFADIKDVSGVMVSSFNNYSTNVEKGLEGLCNDEYRHNNRRHRLKPRWFSEVFTIGGVPFKDVWIEIKHQKKSPFWRANREDQIRCNGTMRIFNGNGTASSTVLVNRSRSNTSILEHTVQNDEPTDLTGNLPSEWVMANSSVFHESFDGGTNPGCRISK
ncbi:MAG: hypothetical protein AB8H12_11220 [Lewinella sp.]